MKLPWVTREHHEAELKRMAEFIDRWDKLHASAMERFDDLLDRYDALKLKGGAAPEPVEVLQRWAPDPVQIAISRKAGANHWLRTHYAQLAHRLRAQNLTEDEIVKTIEDGEDATASGIPG